MRRLRFLVVAGALIAAGSPFVAGQEKGKPKDPPVKLKGQLPSNWAKLGLSEDQKQKVYETQAKYKKDLDELKRKIEELKDKERKDLEDVLTKEQKGRLRDIIAGKIPAGGKN